MNMKKTTKYLCTLIAAVAFIALLVFLESNKNKYGMAVTVLQKGFILAVVAVSMNLLNGFTGLFSLGQAGFMALGAYTYAIFTIPLESRASVYYISGMHPVIAGIELPMFLALIAGGLVAALFAAVIGFPVLRLKSDYLAIATLGFSEIIRALIASPQMDTITNGSYGLKSIPAASIYVVIGLCILSIVVMSLLIHSSFGRAFKAIREDEIAAEAMGINLLKHKELAFVISSFFAGIGGALLAMFMRSIDSSTFKIAMTYDILLIVVIGGMGSITGSVLSALLVTASKEWWLRFFDEPLTIARVNIPLFRNGFRMVIFSILLMVVVLFYRRGIMGTNEFSWDGCLRLLRSIPSRIGSLFHKKEAQAK